MGLYWMEPVGLGAASAAVQYVVTPPQTSHNPINLDFLLDPLSKSYIADQNHANSYPFFYRKSWQKILPFQSSGVI
jgi:hypothetical protein